MEQSSRFHNGLFFLIAGVVLLLGCAGPKVVEVKYRDTMSVLYPQLFASGPPYSPREKPARPVFTEHGAPLHGAEEIGQILIQASDRDNAEKVAPVEVAKFGADFYDVAYSSSPVTGKDLKIDRYSYTRGSRTDYGGRQIITETTISSVDRYLEGWWCTLYRVSPDPKERDQILRWGFRRCVEKCKGILDISSACWPHTLKEYLARGMDPNPNRRIPLLYSFINCIVTAKDLGHWDCERNFEKLRILLDAGADPNMLIKGDIKDLMKYYPVLKNYRKPYPSILKIVRDTIMVRANDLAKLEQEPQKKSEHDRDKTYLDFLKKIEALLVEKGARTH